MSDIELRPMERKDWPEVADLIQVSTNSWYQRGGKPAIFTCAPTDVQLFCKVYEDLDPGCCVIAQSGKTGRIAGSCFYHPRPTHVSLGIMNVHPNYFGQHVAARLLRHITDFADTQGKPVRLVSSAMNLDSFSLYTRAGFVPRQAFQDMYWPVPVEGVKEKLLLKNARIRQASKNDAGAIAALELANVHISRQKDFEYFLANADGIWHGSVIEDDSGIRGFLFSVQHPASNMLGPGWARDEDDAMVLIQSELDHHRGRSPVFLVPADRSDLVAGLYRSGARNCEIHFAQVRRSYQPPAGICMPTFMPETA